MSVLPMLPEHPAFDVFEPVLRERLCALGHFPAPSELRALARGIPSSCQPWFDFTAQDEEELAAAGGFDALLAHSARIPTRPELHHDLLGALIWLHFPALKTAIHRMQLAGGSQRRIRTPSQNAATHFDESGVLVVSSDASLFEALAKLRWFEVFWQQREWLARSARFLAFGHGLLDSLRAAHPRLMGKALFVLVEPVVLEQGSSQLRVLLDRALALRVPELLREPACLQPLPVLGIP
ncbi:MAG TPA: DUF3025 domain-containing protein, partial [Polyangiaceae bacterium]